MPGGEKKSGLITSFTMAKGGKHFLAFLCIAEAAPEGFIGVDISV